MAFKAPVETLERLEESIKRHAHLNMELSQPDVISDRKKFLDLSREHATLTEVVEPFVVFKKKLKDYEESLDILKNEKDKELRQMAEAEISETEPWLVQELKDLQLLLLPKDPRDARDVILELRQGVGGDEAGLFVNDMYRAYLKFAEDLGWKVELMTVSENSSGGFKEVIAGIRGERVYSKLKYESGVHRVQRVPKTETQGRIHTSTITVAILPEADDVEVEINNKDLRIDVMRSSGAGGQHVNTTDSCVRITHLPSGQVVICQDEKSQHKNKAQAMKVLKSRLLQKAVQEQHDIESADRKSQVGSGFRNERIRTYNFPQGRVTDHRIGMTTYNIDEVMQGAFLAFIQALHDHDQSEQLKSGSQTI